VAVQGPTVQEVTVAIPLVQILFLKLGVVPSLLQPGDRKQPEVSPERVPQVTRLLVRTAQV